MCTYRFTRLGGQCARVLIPRSGGLLWLCGACTPGSSCALSSILSPGHICLSCPPPCCCLLRQDHTVQPKQPTSGWLPAFIVSSALHQLPPIEGLQPQPRKQY